MVTKIGEEHDGMQTYLSSPFWQAGFVMRAVYDSEVETADGIETKDVRGRVVFTGERFEWLPDAELLDDFVVPLDFRRIGRSLTLENALVEALGL